MKPTARGKGDYHQKARSLSSLSSLLHFRTRNDGNQEISVSHKATGTIPTSRHISHHQDVPAGYQQRSQTEIRQVTNDDDTNTQGSTTSEVAKRCCYSAPQSTPSQPHQPQLPPNLVCAHHDPCSGGPSYERSGSVSDPAHFPTQSSTPLALAQAPTFTSHQKYGTDTSAASASTVTPSSQLHQLHPSTLILPTLVSSFPSPLLSPIVRSHSPNHNTAYSSPSSEVPSTGRHYPPQPDLVSPISETSSLTPVPSISNRDEEPQLSILNSQVSAPIGQYPLEEDYFVSKPRGRIEHSGVPASATTLDVTHNALQLTTPKTSARIEEDHQQPFLYPMNIISINEPQSQSQSQSKMTTSIASNAINAPAPGDAAPNQSGSPTRQSSFVGLPPIRRTSTFNFLTRNGSRDDDDSSPSPIDPPEDEIPPVPTVPTGLGLQSPDGQLPGRGQKDHIAFHASPTRSQTPTRPTQQQPVNGERSSQNQNGYGSSSHQIPDVLLPGRGATQMAVAQPLGIAPKAQQVLMGHNLSSGQHQPSFGQASGQPSSSFSSNQGHGFMTQPGGNPVQRFPPGGQWKLEESHLSEPLISPNRNRSGTSPPLAQPGYFAYDKETGGGGGGGPSAGPSQPLQRQKNSSIPPISAQRFPDLFAGPHRSSPQNPPQDQDQAYKVQPPSSVLARSQTDDVADHAGRRGSASDLFKEIGSKFGRTRGSSVSDVRGTPNRGDGVSEASGTSGDSKDEDLAPPDKKRAFFGAEGSQPKQRSSLNIVRTALPLEPPPLGPNHADTPDSPAKKRLSDFKGLFKGSAVAAKDDQPAKVITAQPSPNSSAPGFGEARTTNLPGPYAQQRPSGSMAPGPAGGPAGAHETRPPLPVPTQSKSSVDSKNSNEEREKSSGRRMFSNLFGNKSKAPESKTQPGQQFPPQGQPTGHPPGPIHPGQLVQPGQIQPPNQQFAIRQMVPGQSPLQQMTLGPQNPPRPMTSDASASGQRVPGPGGNSTHAKQLSQTSIPPHGQLGVPAGQQQQFAQFQRPNMPPQQASQSSQRLTPSFDDQHPLHSHPITPSKQPGDSLAAAGAALQGSSRSSQEPTNAGEAPMPQRGTPTRKPVGSAPAPARQERGSITSTQSVSTVTQPNSAVSNPEGSESEHDRTSTTQKEDGPATQSPAQKASEFAVPGHMRQPSLPSPAQSPPPQTQTPESSSQSQFTSSPKPSASAQQPASHGINVQPSQQRHSDTSQGQPGQGRQENQVGQTGPPGLGSDLQQNPQMTGALPVSNEKKVQQRPSKFLRSISPQPQKNPTNAEHPEEPLSPMHKLLGPKTKTVIQALPTPQNPKEKSSTSKKILNAFKRSKQQTAAQQQQQQQQQKLQPGQQIPPHMLRPGMPGQPGQPLPGQSQGMPPPGQGRGQIMIPPHIQAQMQAQLHAQMQAHMQAHMQSGRGPMTPQMQTQIQKQIQAQIYAQVQAQLQAQWQAQMQAGRGQIPVHQIPTAGRGQVPPQGPPGAPGQLPPQQIPGQPQPQPQPPGQRPGETQYAQVPIPRGYEAVHGYNSPGRLDISPYDVGRRSTSPSLTPPLQQYQQAQPPPQGSSPGQQWDPRMAPQNPQAPMQQYPVAQPYGQQNVPNQGLPQQPPHNATHLRNLSSGQPQVGVLQQPQPSPGAAPAQTQATQPPEPGQPLPANIVIQAPTPAQQFAVPNNGSPHARQPSLGAQSAHQQAPQQQHVVATSSDAQGSGSSHPISPENHPRSDSALSFAPMDRVGRDQLSMSAQASGDPSLAQQQQNRPLSDLGRMSSQAATTSSGHDSAASGSGATEHHTHLNHARNMSLSPDTNNNLPHDRSLVVSPEPLEHQQHRPLVQQVSSQSIHADVEHEHANQVAPPPPPAAAAALANNNNNGSSDNVVHEQQRTAPSPPEQQPGFYDPSNAKGAAAADDDFPDDSKKQLQPTPPTAVQQPLIQQQQQQHAVAEPEEKILVDQPVELAAVNDDDDGIPMMSATSYPGQEWNPYGAGEFGDWD